MRQFIKSHSTKLSIAMGVAYGTFIGTIAKDSGVEGLGYIIPLAVVVVLTFVTAQLFQYIAKT